jgi:hypothetical protein
MSVDWNREGNGNGNPSQIGHGSRVQDTTTVTVAAENENVTGNVNLVGRKVHDPEARVANGLPVGASFSPHISDGTVMNAVNQVNRTKIQVQIYS